MDYRISYAIKSVQRVRRRETKMGRPRRKSSTRKIKFEIRLQVAVEPGSIEESVLSYLNNEEVRPLGKCEMLMAALKQYWQSAALLQEDQPIERVLSALEDSKFLWSLQEQRLQERIKRKYSTQAPLTNVQEQPKLIPLHETDSQDLTPKISPEPPTVEPTELHSNDSNDDSDLDEAATETIFNPFGDSIIFRN